MADNGGEKGQHQQQTHQQRKGSFTVLPFGFHGLSTVVGLLTFLTALLGVQSAVEIRRGKRYRRSQYLAAGALFSRGLIIVGPTLILFGMIVNLFAKEDFEDERED